MSYVLRYDGAEYQVSDDDAERLIGLYARGEALTTGVYEFNPEDTVGTVIIMVGPGIPLALVTGDD